MVPIVNHPDYVAQIGDDHRFPIKKFGALFELLKKDKILHKNNLHIPKPANYLDLTKAHHKEYIKKIDELSLSKEEERKLGFPMVPSVKRRSYMATGGTVLSAELALKHKLACNTAGGSHHAFPDSGNGYCVFNDVAVAAHNLLSKHMVKKILIYDLDVHQGDGTAKIFENNNKVYTLSIHSKKNYPLVKQKSDKDIELEDNITDDDYLNTVSKSLEIVNKMNFDFVFYVAGVDIHKNDKLGKLNISTEGIVKREKMVIKNFYKNNIPLCGVLGGGYNKDFDHLVYLHSILHRTCHGIINNEY
ncbi:MAG: histone deacetylase [Pelagibacteraceae bacterium]|jgi:acetoin utilization deacetylase AcuC-like enzyme|nr:histone deacetylase [Pelagibacteraceae bacterium]